MGREMPCVDYHEANLERLKQSLQALAAPPDTQLGIYPDFVCKADELALDFDDWFAMSERFLSAKQIGALEPIMSLLDGMSGPGGPWSEEDLRTDARWEQIRGLAKRALRVFKWPIEQPPTSPDVFVPFDGSRDVKR